MKLLWVGGSPGQIGGQSRVTYHTGKELLKLGVELEVAGIGASFVTPGEGPICKIHGGFDSNNGIETLTPIIDKVKPDAILFSHDIWLFYFLPELKAKYPHIPFLGWYTIDATPIHKSWFPMLRATDHIMVPSEFGRTTIYQRFPERTVEVLPYGVDPGFTYTKTKSSAREHSPFAQNHLDKCFFVFAGANQIKKNIGAMIDAFMLYDNPDCHLLLALKSFECAIGSFRYQGEYDLNDLVNNPRIHIIDEYLDNGQLQGLYQMSDFLLYPSQGESPGLQMAEAQLAGCIPLATDYTGLAEESCFKEFLLTDYAMTRGQFGCYRAMVDAHYLAKKMSDAFGYWAALQDQEIEGCEWTHGKAIARHMQFLSDVHQRFLPRTWESSAQQIHKNLIALLSGSTLIDNRLEVI